MSLFPIQRLKRQHWGGDAQSLAEEIFAILNYVSEHGLDGPLKIRTTGDEPALQFLMPDADLLDVPPVQIRANNQIWTIEAFPIDYDPIPIPPVDGFPDFTPLPPRPFPTGGGGGGSLPDRTGGDGGAEDELDPDDPHEDDPFSSPVACMTRVISGSGHSYVCDIWLSDPGSSGSNPPWARFAATCIQIDDDDEIPADTIVPGILYFPATLAGGVRVYIQPAVWAE